VTVHTAQTRWSRETELIAARALENVQPPESDEAEPDEGFVTDARRVLAALNSAGRLLPEGGETRTEYRDRDTVSGGAVIFRSRERADQWCAEHHEPSPYEPWHPCAREVCTVTEWPDGSEHRSPWEPVS
jgi:hypothetical protein